MTIQQKAPQGAQGGKMMPRWLWLPAAIGLVLYAACTLDDPGPPELAGPSELGMSIEMRAVPDQLVSDGFSSSIIEAVVRDASGQRVQGRTITFDITRSGAGFLDLGNLAPVNGARPAAGGVESGPTSAVSDSGGVARVRYWAPFRTDQENDVVVSIAGREASTNFSNQIFRTVEIFLRAANRPSFPGTNVCGFILEPNRPVYIVGEGIAVTATQILGDTGVAGCVGNEIARYEWNVDGVFYDANRGTVVAFDSVGLHTIELVTTEAVSGCQAICSLEITVN